MSELGDLEKDNDKVRPLNSQLKLPSENENSFNGGPQTFSSYNHRAELIENVTQNLIVLTAK